MIVDEAGELRSFDSEERIRPPIARAPRLEPLRLSEIRASGRAELGLEFATNRWWRLASSAEGAERLPQMSGQAGALALDESRWLRWTRAGRLNWIAHAQGEDRELELRMDLNEAALSANAANHRLVVASAAGRGVLVDLDGARVIAELEARAILPPLVLDGRCVTLAADPVQPRLCVYSSLDGRLLQRLGPFDSDPLLLQHERDDELLLLCSSGSLSRLSKEGEIQSLAACPGGPLRVAAASKTGRIVAANRDQLWLYDGTWSRLGRLPEATMPSSLDLSDDGLWVLVGETGGAVVVYRERELHLRAQLHGTTVSRVLAPIDANGLARSVDASGRFLSWPLDSERAAEAWLDRLR